MRPYFGMRHNMAWSKTQDNSRMASTGASMSSFVRKIGSSRTTFSRSAALEKSQPNSALRTQRYCSGCASMEFSVGQYRKREDSSIGACLAQITPCGTALENSVRAGLAASPLNGKPFMQAKSGNRHAVRFGGATRRHASGADLFAHRPRHPVPHPSRHILCGQGATSGGVEPVACLRALPPMDSFKKECEP